MPQAKPDGIRLLNRDGSFNVARKGMRRATTKDAYHRLLSTSWARFLAFTALAYFALNSLFACGYFLAGPHALSGLESTSGLGHFLECFFFSVQTIGTIGYGKLAPASLAANLLVTLETITGILMFAVITGLVFSRFSRPTARVSFSSKAIIANHDGVPSFFFRIANERLNQIAEANLSVTLVRNEYTAEGERFRNFYDLTLERSHSPVFALTWTVVHPIDSKSPFFQAGVKELNEMQAEILVTLTGIDDTFSQSIHARTSYTPEDMVWDYRFEDMLTRESGLILVDLAKLNAILPLG